MIHGNKLLAKLNRIVYTNNVRVINKGVNNMAKLNYITSKEELTVNQKEAIYTIKYLLEQITKSNSYEIRIENNVLQIVLYTTKYLLPIDKQYNREYTHVISCYLGSRSKEVVQVINTLYYCKKFEGMNTGLNHEGLPLHIFIEEVYRWLGMCSSLHTYGNKIDYLYSDTYNLNVKLKEILYNETKELITNIQYAGEDSEGLSYNSSTMLLAI